MIKCRVWAFFRESRSPVCGGTLSWMARRMTFAMGLSGFFWDSGCSRDRSSQPATLSAYIRHRVLFTLPVPWGRIWALMLHILALTPREHKLTRLLFSLCAVVFSLVWLMRSIQTRLPWLLTPPTSGFPVYTMTTACMCGMSKTRRKWARCTLLCTTLPACGILRYVVCRHKFWIASCSWGSHLKSCQIWMQALTAERKNWLRFRPVVSVVATGLELELGTVLWLHSNGWPNALDAVCCWKKNLTIERWEVGEGAELDKAERRVSFHKTYKSLLLTSNKIIWGLWWASAPKSKEWNKW